MCDRPYFFSRELSMFARVRPSRRLQFLFSRSTRPRLRNSALLRHMKPSREPWPLPRTLAVASALRTVSPRPHHQSNRVPRHIRSLPECDQCPATELIELAPTIGALSVQLHKRRLCRTPEQSKAMTI